MLRPSTATIAVAVVVGLATTVAACWRASAPRFAFDTHIGVAKRRNGLLCLDIGSVSLARGTLVQLVTATPTPAVVSAEIAGPLDRPCGTTPGSIPRSGHYALALRGDTAGAALPSAMPAFGVVGAAGDLIATPMGARGDLEGDGRVETFHVCTSQEGVHLSVWSGPIPSGTRRWHHYVALGYDVSPTCTAAETQPDSV
jgi:hypothetical protein